MKKPTQKTLTEKETDKVNETTRLLSHSVQIARETDSLSNITLEEMTKQGKQLEQTQKQLQGTEGIALNTNTAVKKLQQRIYERKVYLWATIIGLFLIILLLLFRMVTNHGKLFA